MQYIVFRFINFFILLSVAGLGSVRVLYAQGCCSGGSGSPIAGGASQGVLQHKQMETSLTYQYFYSNRFKTGDKDTVKLFDRFSSNYLYARVGYGIAKSFTFFAEAGYYLNKTQVGLNRSDTITSSGIADLILFPRYNIYLKSNDKKKWEITLGLGYKIPLGTHNDSTHVFTNPFTGQQYFTTSPPLVQPTNGSQDVIFYGFALRGFPAKKFQVFANILYIKKGWNSLGQKFGDYTSIGLFASKQLHKYITVNCQVRGEWIQPMQHDRNIDMLAMYNINVQSTGSHRVCVVPQLNIIYKSFTFYTLGEWTPYEYVNGAQVANKILITTGLAYRFYV